MALFTVRREVEACYVYECEIEAESADAAFEAATGGDADWVPVERYSMEELQQAKVMLDGEDVRDWEQF